VATWRVVPCRAVKPFFGTITRQTGSGFIARRLGPDFQQHPTNCFCETHPINLAGPPIGIRSDGLGGSYFTVSPSTVSTSYAGTVTLQIGDLTNRETVVVQKFIDVNPNGVIDASEWLAQ
jgi:hypothetical protein